MRPRDRHVGVLPAGLFGESQSYRDGAEGVRDEFLVGSATTPWPVSSPRIALALSRSAAPHGVAVDGAASWFTSLRGRVGMPMMHPPGGHAVYIAAKALLPHIPAECYPGQALACALYLERGIRSCEIGSVIFGKRGQDGSFSPAAMKLVRLALPRRVYTKSHIDRVIEIVAEMSAKAHHLTGLRMTHAPRYLAHVTARFEPSYPARRLPAKGRRRLG